MKLGRLTPLLVASGLAVTLLGSPVAAANRGSTPPNNGTPGRAGPHVMPKTNPSTGPSPAAAVGAHLSYYGGRVITAAKVEDVYWGSGVYEPGVGSGGSMPAFFNAIGGSAYFDWLAEYNTNKTAVGGQHGTDQVIGHATFLNELTMAPSQANNGQTIDDSNIQAELKAQLASGGLPAPLTDGHGNVDTLYALYFPQGKRLTTGSSTGGVNWCAYHGTIVFNRLSVPYMVLPDFADKTQSGIDYTSGCGSDPTLFNDFTSVTSHELVESVTDTEVGLAPTTGPPLAWYDSNNGEIGDICNAQQGAIAGYVVQTQWSNTAGGCIVRPANDFAMTAGPSSLSVAQGGAGTSTIGTTVTAGSGQSVALSASGLPSGVTASFSPSSVTSGNSSTLTLNVGGAPVGTYTILVTGSGPSAVHDTALTLTVTPGANDFSISASPGSLTLAHGGSGTSTITTAVTFGSAETVSLAASGLPAGANATFNPASVTAGNSSTVTIQAGTAAAGTYTVTVTGSAANGPHSTSLSVTILRVATALAPRSLSSTGRHPTARLTRSDTKAPLAGQTVTFTIPFGTGCSAVTNSNGVAACSTTVLSFNGYTASYAGNAVFLPSSAHGN